ncbi:MAG TPA: pirin family protein [Candidatus Tumulicola sp.]|nr:pirin family protein [Candidatus Tumulicola sp.]
METQRAVFTVQRSDDRYCADHGWLKTCHSFSFADYQDPSNQNWGALRVLNDDTIAPGEGFPAHPHRDMEILTYVLDGELEHQDDMGNRGVVGPGSVQYMSAGTGVKHSEFNHSKERPLHLVQMWVLPGQRSVKPSYGQREFTLDDRRNRWLLVASGRPGEGAPVKLMQDASFSVARLEAASLSHEFAPSRFGFLFVTDGTLSANDEQLKAGDAVRIAGVPSLKIAGSGELLLWDLPPL